MKRKRQLSTLLPKRSIQRKQEPKGDLMQMSQHQLENEEGSHQNIIQKPSLLSRLGSTTNFLNKTKETLDQSLTLENQRNDLVSLSQTCHGSIAMISENQELIQAVSRQSSPSTSSTGTSKAASSLSALPQDLQTTSHLPSGSEFSEESPLISTKSCLLFTGLQLLKSGRRALEAQISYLDQLKQQGKLPPHPTGRLPGSEEREQLPLSSHTAHRNLKVMPNILRANSLPKSQWDITTSSCLTLQSETLYTEGNKCYSLKPINSAPSTQPSSCQMGSSTALEVESNKLDEGRRKPATDSMTKGVAAKTAGSITTAGNAEAPIMAKLPVKLPLGIELYGMCPKYLQYNVWDPEGNLAKTTVEWTETAKPLPRPPPAQLMDPIIGKTVSENPELFKIVTPVKVEVFEDLLRDHPNQAFIKSVSDGLRYGDETCCSSRSVFAHFHGFRTFRTFIAPHTVQ